MTEVALSPMPLLCVDDNRHVAAALKTLFARTQDFAWAGWLASADELVAEVRKQHAPAAVVLDLDMPGLDPFTVLASVSAECPDCRVVVFSGHVRFELIERALAAGAWGYVSKNDGETALLEALRLVRAGELGLSHDVRIAYGLE